MNVNSINTNPMNINPLNMEVSTALGRMAVGDPPTKLALKSEKAARDFESMLLASGFDSLQKTFAWDSESTTVGASTYRTMATKALADTVAAGGGIGIARLILRHLPVTKVSANG